MLFLSQAIALGLSEASAASLRAAKDAVREVARPADLARERGVALDRQRILVTAKTGDGRIVELILDLRLVPLFALVDGVRVFDARAAGEAR